MLSVTPLIIHPLASRYTSTIEGCRSRSTVETTVNTMVIVIATTASILPEMMKTVATITSTNAIPK